MITRWGIKNFKSVKEAEVDFTGGGLTVLTGTNSAGKSSLFQSLLFACQSAKADGKITLNGKLVRLGGPRDVIRSGCRLMTLSYSDNNTEDSWRDISRTNGALSTEISLYEDRSVNTAGELAIDQVRLGISKPSGNYDAKGKRKTLGAELAELGKNVTGDWSNTKRVVLRRTDASRGAKGEGVTRLAVSQPKSSQHDDLSPQVTFHGLFPYAIYVPLNQSSIEKYYKRYLIKLEDRLLREMEKDDEKEDDGWYDEAYLDYALDASIPMRAGNGWGYPYRDLLFEAYDENELEELGFDPLYGIEKPSFPEIEKLVDACLQRRLESPWVIVYLNEKAATDNHWRRGILEEAVIKGAAPLYDALRSMPNGLKDLSRSLRYIGPLRDEPKVVSASWEDRDLNLPVGSRGELTSFVLNTSADTPADYVLPPKMGRKIVTLNEAVNSWARYIGVASELEARSFGSLGMALSVKTGSESDIRDLTMVGVGVSQLAPILVGLLSCDDRSILLIEQPELHLHPSAQSRLADFLLYVKPEVSVMVETHSAALVTRLRRRAAESGVSDFGAELIKRMRILFFESADDVSGNTKAGTTVRKMSFDEYGNLSDWPRGFLDTIDEDTRAIVKANIALRQQAPWEKQQ